MSDIRDSLSSFFNSQVKTLVNNTDQRAIPLDPIGIELETFAEKVLFNCNAMVMGRFFEVYGPPRSCKSAFMFDRYKYMLRNGGKYFHCDNEDKDAPSLRTAILEYPVNHSDSDWVRRADTMDEWMANVKDIVTWWKKLCGDEPKEGKKGSTLGRAAPLSIGIDSLMSKLAGVTLEQIEKNGGVPEIGYPREANILTQWFKYFQKEFCGWPVYVWLVNHGKQKIDSGPYSANKFYAPGGAAQNFHVSYRLLFKHLEDIKRNDEGLEGHSISIKTDKNSFGVTNTVVDVDLLWKNEIDAATGENRQIAWWDWHSATTQVCNEAIKPRSGFVVGERGRRVKDILGLRQEPRGMWSCSTLDVSSDDPVSATDMGKLINSNKEIVRALEDVFNIKQIPIFQPGVDIRKTIEEWKSNHGPIAREESPAYSSPTN